MKEKGGDDCYGCLPPFIPANVLELVSGSFYADLFMLYHKILLGKIMRSDAVCVTENAKLPRIIP